MQRKTVDWEAVWIDYRAGNSLRAVGIKHGVSHVAVKKKADKQGWGKNPPPKLKLVAGAQFNKGASVNQSVNHEQKVKCRVGAPSIKTPQLLEAICNAISDGVSARAACLEIGISQRVLWEWLAADRAFAQQYARAKEWYADLLADEVLAIADDSSGDSYINEKGRKIVNHEVLARARLQIDARKWYVSKLAPKKYGRHFLEKEEKTTPVHCVRVTFV